MAQSFDVEWTKPEGAPTSFVQWEMEKTYLLWNVGAQGFYTNHPGGAGGPYYGTRATVYSDRYNVVKFTRTNPGGNQEDWTKEGVMNRLERGVYQIAKK